MHHANEHQQPPLILGSVKAILPRTLPGEEYKNKATKEIESILLFRP